MNQSENHTPMVSVLLPIYNAGDHLRATLDSTLAQTFGDFEVIAIDDGSTDHSAQIIQSYADPRLRFHQQTNMGLAGTLNRAAGMARGKYLARQDQDDLSMPERFAKQVAYLESHPEVYLLGTGAEIWEGDRRTERVHRHPTDPVRLTFELLFDNYFVHSSVMMRGELFSSVGWYCTDKARQPEDFELWSRTSRRHAVANLPDILQVYRECEGSMCRTGAHPYRDGIVRICSENLAYACGAAGPGPEHVAIASMIHNAPTGEGSGWDLEQLEGVLRVASARIAERFSVGSGVLEEAVNNRCQCLRSHFVSGHFVGRLRSLPSRIARRLGMPLSR